MFTVSSLGLAVLFHTGTSGIGAGQPGGQGIRTASGSAASPITRASATWNCCRNCLSSSPASAGRKARAREGDPRIRQVPPVHSRVLAVVEFAHAFHQSRE